MSDRWGPSEDCIVCGQAISVIDLRRCSLCRESMCKKCIESHVCKEIDDECKDES